MLCLPSGYIRKNAVSIDLVSKVLQQVDYGLHWDEASARVAFARRQGAQPGQHKRGPDGVHQLSAALPVLGDELFSLFRRLPVLTDHMSVDLAEGVRAEWATFLRGRPRLFSWLRFMRLLYSWLRFRCLYSWLSFLRLHSWLSFRCLCGWGLLYGLHYRLLFHYGRLCLQCSAYRYAEPLGCCHLFRAKVGMVTLHVTVLAMAIKRCLTQGTRYGYGPGETGSRTHHGSLE
jgi:hypothetical protein